MTTSSPAGTTTQRPRWRSGLALLVAAAAATIGLAVVPALSASASPVAARPAAATVRSPAFTSGTYTLYYSWGCTGQYASVQQTFNSDGTITVSGSSGKWVVQDGTIMWNYTAGPAIYSGNVDGPAAVGMMTAFTGSSTGNGCWYALKAGTGTGNGPPPYEPGTTTTTRTKHAAHSQQGLAETGNTR
jgi:hypothetical protein